MVWVHRSEENKIDAVFYGGPSPGYAEEELPDDHPDVLDFDERLRRVLESEQA
jgi:hypothetical protein